MFLFSPGIEGPFAGVLSRRFGSGTVIMMCGVLTATAAIAGSFAVSALQLALGYMLLAGQVMRIHHSLKIKKATSIINLVTFIRYKDLLS